MSMEEPRTPGAPTSPGAYNSRPRPESRNFSFRSDRSAGSDGKSNKYQESPREKAKRDSLWKGQSKANPNAALAEAQPGAANLLEESTLQNIRELEHKDNTGNVIRDPDRSNPTRPRMERPLDTIRSFEKAIDDGYKRRSSYVKPEGEQYDPNNQFASKRSSYFAGHDNNGPSPNRYGGGYYGNQRVNGYHGQPRPRYDNSRFQSDPQHYSRRPYNAEQAYQSHDTVNTNGSDSTGPWASGTDPSSENSSLDKVNGAMNKSNGPAQTDGYNNYGNGVIMEEQGQGAGAYQQDGYADEYGYDQHNGYPQQNGYAAQHSGHPQNGYPQHSGHQQNGYPQQSAYPQPNGYAQPGSSTRQDGREGYGGRHRNNSAPMLGGANGYERRPIPLSKDSYGPRPPINLSSQSRPDPAEKRKSWFKRRFGKD